MCDYCNKFHNARGITIGEPLKIKPCVAETNLKDCNVYLHDGDIRCNHYLVQEFNGERVFRD